MLETIISVLSFSAIMMVVVYFVFVFTGYIFYVGQDHLFIAAGKKIRLVAIPSIICLWLPVVFFELGSIAFSLTGTILFIVACLFSKVIDGAATLE